MSLADLLELSAAVLASIGGASLLLFAMSNWLGKVWADRLMRRETAEFSRDLEALKNKFLLDAESHKVKLKKSEFLFAKEVEATSALVSIFRGLLPRHAWPDMDWYDACDFIATNFDKIERTLDNYLATHGAVVDDEVVNHISRCVGIAGSNKFGISSDAVSAEANKAANELYEELKQAEEKMLKHIRQQATV
jgi:hypothetical protein